MVCQFCENEVPVEDLFCGRCGLARSDTASLPPLEDAPEVSSLEVEAEDTRDAAPALVPPALASEAPAPDTAAGDPVMTVLFEWARGQQPADITAVAIAELLGRGRRTAQDRLKELRSTHPEVFLTNAATSAPPRVPSSPVLPVPPSSPALPVSPVPTPNEAPSETSNETSEVLPAGWLVSFPDLPAAPDVPLTNKVVVLGRRPAPPTRFPTAQLVQIDDGKGMTSRSHVRLEFHDEVWEVTDLGSLNGVSIIRTAANGDDMLITMGELTARLIKGELPQ